MARAKHDSFDSEELPHFTVHYYYEYDAGVHTFRNGDPGYPPSEDFGIDKVTYNGQEVNPTKEDYAILERELEKHISQNEDLH